MPKQLQFKEEARDSLRQGIDTLSRSGKDYSRTEGSQRRA